MPKDDGRVTLDHVELTNIMRASSGSFVATFAVWHSAVPDQIRIDLEVAAESFEAVPALAWRELKGIAELMVRKAGEMGG